MKKIIFLANICLLLLCTGCEKRTIVTTVTLYGTVYDVDSYAPIQGAMLTIQPGGRNAYTGSDGTYQYDDLDTSEKKYTVTVTAKGYRSDRKSLVVESTPGESLEMSFALQKE